MTETVATLNPEEALALVKQVDADIQELAKRALSFQEKVHEVHENTNMPVVNQIFDITSKLADSLKKVQDSTADALDIMTKYTESVEDIANDASGLSSID